MSGGNGEERPGGDRARSGGERPGKERPGRPATSKTVLATTQAPGPEPVQASPLDTEAMDIGLMESGPVDPDFLYRLLPRILRNQDAGQGEPLRALMRVLNRQYDLLHRDVEGLYDNWFIETCDEWVVPYLGELVGLGLDRRAELPWDARSFVANAIAYRRSKGTPAALKAAVGDATGWPSRVVEPYRRVAATPTLLSPGTASSRTVDLRDAAALSALGGPEDSTVRTARVERPAGGHPGGEGSVAAVPGPRCGRDGCAPDQLELYLWRLDSFPVDRGTARKVDTGLYTFHPFGIDRPLFCPRWRFPAGLGDEEGWNGRSGPEDADGEGAAPEHRLRPRPLPGPGPVDPQALAAEIEDLRRDPGSGRRYFGRQPVLRVWADGESVPPQAVEIRDLSSWQRPPATALYRQSSPGEPTRLLPVRLAVDPRRGRLAFAAGREPEGRVEVSYSYGLAGDLGGGPYPRPPDRTPDLPDTSPHTFQALVGEDLPATAEDGPRRPCYPTLWQALEAWDASGCHGRIRIADSALHALGRQGDLELDLNGRRLVIEAADGAVPALWGRLRVSASSPSLLKLSGLWLDSPVEARGQVVLHLEHSTVQPVPGRTSLQLEGRQEPGGDRSGEAGAPLSLWLESSVVGAIDLGSGSAEVLALDSVVDGPLGYPERGGGETTAGGPAPRPYLVAELLRSTFFGPVRLTELRRGEDLLFVEPLTVEGGEGATLDYSYVPPGSRTPPRVHCQPDEDPEGSGAGQGSTGAVPRPVFTSTRFGQPGYARLSHRTPVEIRSGGRGGSEMGVFHRLEQSRRQAALATVLEEFVPWGLEVLVRYVT